jgi:hypothetical protein
MSAPFHRWLGSSVVLAVGLVLGFLSVAAGYSPWLLAGLAVAAAIGVFLTWPGRDEPENERSAFVRGDASGSTFDEVVSDGSDSFIDGDALGAIFRRVIHRAPRRPRRRKDR